MCAVPVSVLWDPAAFDHGGHIGREVERPMKVVAPESGTGEANSRKLVDANLFLSYCRKTGSTRRRSENLWETFMKPWRRTLGV